MKERDEKVTTAPWLLSSLGGGGASAVRLF